MMNSNNDDASLWWKSRHTDVQDYEVPDIDTVEDTTFLNIEEVGAEDAAERTVTSAEVRKELNMTKLNEPTARIIVSLMDVVLPLILIALIKGSDKNTVKLDENEREALTAAWAEYLKTTAFSMSPGSVLITTIATIYGAKVTVAIMDRKKHDDELQVIKEQNELLRQQYAAQQENPGIANN